MQLNIVEKSHQKQRDVKQTYTTHKSQQVGTMEAQQFGAVNWMFPPFAF